MLVLTLPVGLWDAEARVRTDEAKAKVMARIFVVVLCGCVGGGCGQGGCYASALEWDAK